MLLWFPGGFPGPKAPMAPPGGVAAPQPRGTILFRFPRFPTVKDWTSQWRPGNVVLVRGNTPNILGRGAIQVVTWTITKRLEGNLDGIVVTEAMTQDASLPAPFTAGQRVNGLGCPYTILEVTRG